MATKHEKQRAGEFIVSEGNGTYSREVGVLAEQTEAYLDGTLLMTDTGDLVPWDADDPSDIVGILIGYHDTLGESTTARNAVYIARKAEVKAALLQYGTDDNEVIEAAQARLRAMGIQPRLPNYEGVDVTESETTSESGTASEATSESGTASEATSE